MPSKPSPPEENEALLIAALTHAWSWVEAQAARRAQTVNLYLIAIAFLTTVWAAEVNNRLYDLAGATSITSALTAVAFWRADLRLRKYLDAGEESLAAVQGRFAASLGIDALRITERARRSVPATMSLSTLLNVVFAASFASSVAGAIYGFGH